MKAIKKTISIIMVMMLALTLVPMTALANAPANPAAAVDGTSLTITFNANLRLTPLPLPAAFVVAGGGAPAVNEVAIAGMVVTLTLAAPIPFGASDVTVAYTLEQAGSGGNSPLVDTTGAHQVTNFSSLSVQVNTPNPRHVIPGTTTVTGEGLTQYINTEIYDVSVPTDGALNFVLDPLGLHSIAVGDNAILETLTGGTIIHTAGRANLINNSSVPLAASVRLQASTTGGNLISRTTDYAQTIALVEPAENTQNNILLWARPSMGNIIVPATPFSPSSTAFVIDATPRTMTFVLGAADYRIARPTDQTFTATMVPGTSHGTAIELGGRINTNADWSSFTGTSPSSNVRVTATFSFATPTEGQTGAEGVAGVYSMIVTAAPPSIELPVPAPIGFTSTEHSSTPTALNLLVSEITPHQELVIAFNFGELVSPIISVATAAGTAVTNAYWSFSTSDNTFTYVASRATIFSNLAGSSHNTITVNGVEYRVNFVVVP